MSEAEGYFMAALPSSMNSNLSQAPLQSELACFGTTMITVGTFGFLVNLITILMITRSKDLRSSCFKLIAVHAFYGCVMSVGFVICGAHLLGLAIGRLTALYTRLKCYFVYLPTTISFIPSSISTSFIALERMLAVAFPLSYEAKKKPALVVGITLACMFGIGTAIAAVVSAPRPLNEVIKCWNPLSMFSDQFAAFFSYCNFVFQASAVVNYGVMYVVLKCRIFLEKREAKKAGDARQAWTAKRDPILERQMSLLPVTNRLLIAYTAFAMGPPMIASVFSVVSGGIYFRRATIYALALRSVSVLIDFSVLVLNCDEFRSGLNTFISGRISVHPISKIRSVTVSKARSVP